MLKHKPTARPNRRYVLVEGTQDAAEKALLEYFGLLGWSRAAPVFLSHGTNIIVTVNRSEIEHVRAAFAVYAKPLKVLRVSGTLKGLGMK